MFGPPPGASGVLFDLQPRAGKMRIAAASPCHGVFCGGQLAPRLGEERRQGDQLEVFTELVYSQPLVNQLNP